jgi:RNA polymerase sigma factor FliA
MGTGTHENIARAADGALVELWRSYQATGDQRIRNRLVLSLAPLVKQIVYRRARQLPRHCELEDFLSCGLEALIRALDRFDPAHGVGLEQFVWTRIHGAVLDEARRQDWAPRSVRRFERERARAQRDFQGAHGRAPSRDELAAALAIEPEELRRLEHRLATVDVHSLNMPVNLGEGEGDLELLDTLSSPDASTQPEEALLASDAREGLHRALAGLSERDREIAELLYVEELTMREVGDRLGVTESRVSQLNSRIKRTVRSTLEAQAAAAETALAA